MAEINITIRGESAEDVYGELENLLGQRRAPRPEKPKDTTPETPPESEKETAGTDEQPAGKTTKKKTTKKKAAKKAAQERAAQRSATSEDDGDDEPAPPSLEDLRGLAEQVVEAHGVERIKTILTEHDAAKLSSVTEDKRASFAAACNRAIKEAGDE